MIFGIVSIVNKSLDLLVTFLSVIKEVYIIKTPLKDGI